MDRKEAWQCFENTGSVEAYLAYRALEQKESEYDLQSQRNSAEDQTHHS
ncbi:MAG: YqzL family protein [Clostridia bacterium]|nr:YqzL family protein [Clostridia bacterium]